MNHIPCEHPRQTLKSMLGADAPDGDAHCATPGCPAGPDIIGRNWIGEGVAEAASGLTGYRRVETDGVWRWLAMPTIHGHAMVPDDFPDWLEAQVERLAALGATAIEPKLPYHPGDVLAIKLEWEGKAMELSHQFGGTGPEWDASVRAFKSALERFPSVVPPPESEG